MLRWWAFLVARSEDFGSRGTNWLTFPGGGIVVGGAVMVPRKPSLRSTLEGLVCVAILGSPAAAETRYHQHCAKAKGSDGQVKAIAATYFGGPSAEELVAVGWAQDGGVLVVGNAWGPEFVAEPSATVIGEDRYTTAEAVADEAKGRLNYDNPNTAGFVVRFSPGLRRVASLTRFGWGNATANKALFGRGGAIYLSGKCTAAFAEYAQQEELIRHTVSPPEGAKASGGNLHLSRLAADGKRLEWALVFEQAEGWSSQWEGRQGDKHHPGLRVAERSDGSLVFVAYDRLHVLTPDGKGLKQLSETRGGVLLATAAEDDSVYLGSDVNTNTGREPWRQPFLTKYDREGKVLWEAWRWDSKTVGADKYRLVSDSGIWGTVRGPDDRRLVWGWSDGGNSVFLRQPFSLDDSPNSKGSFIDSLWGANVGKFSWLMQLDEEEREVTQVANWCSFLTTRNKPNSSMIHNATVLADGRVAFVGSSSFALVESPDAWVRAFPEGAGGAYFALLSADLRDLLFSSTLPAASGPMALAQAGTQLVVGGKARPADPERGPVLVNAIQGACAGPMDGYILLIETKSKVDE
jgi:hypothetical protein